VHPLPDQTREVCVGRVKVHARSRRERPEPEDVDLDAAFDRARDEPGDELARFGRRFYDGLDGFFAQRFAGEDHQTTAAAVVVHPRQEAVTDRRNQIVRLHFAAIEDREGFAGEIDHDGGVEHRGDLTEDLFTDVKRSAFGGPRRSGFALLGALRLLTGALLLTATSTLLLLVAGHRFRSGV